MSAHGRGVAAGRRGLVFKIPRLRAARILGPGVPKPRDGSNKARTWKDGYSYLSAVLGHNLIRRNFIEKVPPIGEQFDA
jgi:hypothetical protein